jgi:hypothetical protein
MAPESKTPGAGGAEGSEEGVVRLGSVNISENSLSRPRAQSVPAVREDRLPVLAAQINQAHDLACRSAQSAISHAIAVGEGLLEAKALLGHGEWLPWLAENFDFSERTAQKYIRLAKHRDEVTANAKEPSYLAIDEALKAIRKIPAANQNPEPFGICQPKPVAPVEIEPRSLSHQIRTVGLDPACGLGQGGDDTEALQAELDELREINAALEAENDSLRAELKRFDEMRLQWERGGFEEVIAGRDERIRVLNRRLESESHEKVRNLNSMEYWKKQAIKLGWTNPNHVVIPLDDAPDVPRGAA